MLFLLALVAAPLPVLAQGVTVALMPASQTVAPGAEFDLSIEVIAAGSRFNAFDAFIGYDPAALTPVPLSPISLQEGAYFAAACSNRFHIFGPGADRDTIRDALLCAGVSLQGPGQIYKLRFRASNTPQITTVQFLPGLRFFNEGLFVNPVTSSNARIGIGVAAGVGDSPAKVRAPRLLASPNPSSSGAIVFRIEMDREATQRLLVCDLEGRVVRHLQGGTFPAGIRSVSWDGRNDSGVVVPPGVYLGTLRAGGKMLKARFTILN